MRRKLKVTACLLAMTCLLGGCGKQTEQTDVSTETEIVLESESKREFQHTAEAETETELQTADNKETKVSETSATTEQGATTSSAKNAASGSTKSTPSTTAASASKRSVVVTTAAPSQQKNTVTQAAAASTTAKASETTAAAGQATEPVATEEVPVTEAPETEEPATETTTEMIPKSGTVDEILLQMTLEEKIYQLFIVTPEMLTGMNVVTAAGETTRNALAAQPVSGMIYFSANLNGWAQTTTMLSNSQQYARESGIGLFLAVDEEGGTVARCANNLGTTQLSSMATYGARNDWNEAYWIGQTLGNDIHQFGFNVDFAPVADVNINSANELGTRIFSSDANVVANMVSGVVSGIQSTGVAATLKHFPGLGAESGNAHYDNAVYIYRTLDQLRAEEFVPFRAGIEAGCDFVMVSHQIVTGIGDNLPASLSYTVCTDLLRNELGFTGIIITDSFQMNTISESYSAADSAVLAIEAGVDIILMPTNLTESVQGILEAVNSGRISEDRINQSVQRILTEKEKMGLLG